MQYNQHSCFMHQQLEIHTWGQTISCNENFISVKTRWCWPRRCGESQCSSESACFMHTHCKCVCVCLYVCMLCESIVANIWNWELQGFNKKFHASSTLHWISSKCFHSPTPDFKGQGWQPNKPIVFTKKRKDMHDWKRVYVWIRRASECDRLTVSPSERKSW